ALLPPLTLSTSLSLVFFFFSCCPPHRHLHSFPTRRSSDLASTSDSTSRWSARASTGSAPHEAIAARTSESSVPSSMSSRTAAMRSEEHTSELQSRENLVRRLLLEKKNRIETTQAKTPRLLN